MAQARIPAGAGEGSGVGSEYLDDSTQIPTAISWQEVPGRVNRMDNVDEFQFTLSGSSSGEVVRFVARDNGRVLGILVKNGSVAGDGTNGWELDVLDEDQSDAELGHFGIGTGTNAASANDNKAVAANATAYLSNSLGSNGANRFSRGDVITVDATEDGTAGAADIVVLVQYESSGHV